jgi:hypothetical protein
MGYETRRSRDGSVGIVTSNKSGYQGFRIWIPVGERHFLLSLAYRHWNTPALSANLYFVLFSGNKAAGV